MESSGPLILQRGGNTLHVWAEASFHMHQGGFGGVKKPYLKGLWSVGWPVQGKPGYVGPHFRVFCFGGFNYLFLVAIQCFLVYFTRWYNHHDL